VVPIHTVAPAPNSPPQAPNPSPAGPAAPGSPQADPGTPKKPEPQQDSLEDIRNDLDHEPGGLGEVDPDDQDRLEDSFPQNPDGTPQRFPDPFGPWSQLQNDGGNTVPGRSNNCADCSRSFLESWRGNPQVSAPRTLDTDEHGNLDPWTPEDNANENQIRWSGAPHSYAGEGNDPDTVTRIEDDLLQAGHGAHAIIQVDWPGGGGHAFNAVNYNGDIVYIDTQSGEVSHDPLHIDNAEHVWHIPMDPDGNPLHPAEPAESDTDDAQNQNDESQPDNSENNEQPENNPQNDATGNTPKQGDDTDTDTGTNSPKTADPTSPDASNNSDPAQPSTADPNTTPDPTNGKPENENGQPQSESNKPSQPDSTPDGRQPSPDDNNNAAPQPQQSPSPETPSEQNRPSPAETPSTPDQSRPDDPTRPDEQTRAPDKESQPSTATTESPARPDSPSEHRQPPTHTTPANADNGTPDNGSTPTRTATDTPSDPTTNRDTPQQTTTPSDPRTSIPHQQTADPRTTDPRAADPRTTDPRTSDPRTSDPHRDTPTQKRPETNERPDGQRPNTPPRPDQTRPDHLDDPRSETPDKDRSETPDQTRPDPNESPTDNHHDRPSDMNKDSAVPTRESLPDGRNADAANYVKDAVNGKKPLYGDIAHENAAQTSRSTSPDRPSGPAEPAGNTPDNQESRRQRDLDMLARANSKDEKDRAWFEKYYHPKSGYRRSVTAPAEDGRPVPQLHPTNDPNTPWMLANDAPDADEESYIDEGEEKGKRDEEISEENLKRLDKAAKVRQQAIVADRQPHADRRAAKKAYESNPTEENRKKFEKADADHSPLHGQMTRASEDYGEQVAEFHAMPRHFPDYTRIDDRATGNNRFDQIWVDPNTDPPEFIVVEAKGSLKAGLGERRGLPEDDGSGPSAEPDNSPSQAQDDSNQNDENEQNAPSPGVPKVRQGTRAYFETILQEMQDRADRNELRAKTDAEVAAAKAERQLADDLDKALKAKPSRIKYLLVKGNADGEKHNGYEMQQFDIRTEAEKENDADSAA